MATIKPNREEEKLLKVAMLNRDESEKLKTEMRSLNKDWNKNNQADEEFLKAVEARLGIRKEDVPTGDFSFKRESLKASPKNWEELYAEADSMYRDGVGFEDLLSQQDFVDANRRIEEIDREFEKKTGIRKKDFAFLAVAIALQCTRQYVLDPWLKTLRAEASPNDEKGRKGKAEPGWYYVPTEKIPINRVPFDAQHYSDNSTVGGFLKGGDHRSMTLGHDPVLGWLFGTVNIMTCTLTRRDMASAHIKVVGNENKIHSLASTPRIFESVLDRVMNEGIDGKVALGSAIVREAIHLKSDVGTKNSLPLPGIGELSPELANELAKYGIDIASVGTEAALSCLINHIIGMVHRLCFDETKDDAQFYEVRTRKILLYSNLIASTSNVIYSVLTEQYQKFDVGGLLVTISRLITDVRFICRVKDEFVNAKLDEEFQKVEEETERLYANRMAD